ncbi:hypothetical protein DQG13_23035 [Paenibacillus sp. YN15]|nr:hypothetical protein DQG13_23035 [Paenibacillus sp. YN15]
MRRLMKVEVLAGVAAVIILAWLLLWKPVIGMADNGDFLRIMGTVGLDYTDPSLTYEQKYFGWFIREFAMKGLGLGGYASTSLLPVMIGKLLCLATGRELFDMRAVAVVYGALFVAGAWLLLRFGKGRNMWGNALLGVLFVIMFADIGYSAYYNSLFSEPMAYVAMLLTLGFVLALLRGAQPMGFYLWGFAIAAVLLIGAKVQNAPVGLLLALLGVRLGALRKGGGWRKKAGWLAVVLVAASVAIYVSLPREIKIINQYQTVFYGVLKGSENPAADLRELGLPEKLAVNAGTNYFEPAPIDQHDPVFEREYYPAFSHLKVGLFYLKHPGRFWDKLEVAGEHGMTIRPYYLGSFEQSEGLKAWELSDAFSLWSEFKHRVLPNKLWFILLVFVLYYALLIRRYLDAFRLRDRIRLEVLAGLGLVALFQFVTPVVGDGEADLAKHLFGFNVSFDLMLWFGVMLLLERLPVRGRRGGAVGQRPGRQN